MLRYSLIKTSLKIYAKKRNKIQNKKPKAKSYLTVTISRINQFENSHKK